ADADANAALDAAEGDLVCPRAGFVVATLRNAAKARHVKNLPPVMIRCLVGAYVLIDEPYAAKNECQDELEVIFRRTF
ncbi:MAG TPA: hypothetical protein PK156_23220, partial [Polyangium sp.]|nr:hypothetical protein [Polyangium sp.]